MDNPESDTLSRTSPSNSDCSGDGSVTTHAMAMAVTVRYKPHRGNDRHWAAIQRAEGKSGGLGLANFRLLKKLGFGDIGSVYLAELCGSGGCIFAMKVMDKEALSARNKLCRSRTEKEILLMLDHPFLPTLYSHFETDKYSCLVMEFCSGGDLHTLRQKQPGKHFSEQAARFEKNFIFRSSRLVLTVHEYLTVIRCRFYASEVLLAMEYLHMMGVVYRDLKPENVLVREDGHIMLTDFDLSLKSCFVNPTLRRSSSFVTETCDKASAYCIRPPCRIEPTCKLPTCFTPKFRRKTTKKKTSRVECISISLTQTSSSLPELVAEPTTAHSMSFVGTHEYLAPEIIRGDGHGSAVDWWTFGVFLYELLHGKTPFKGEGNRATLFNVVGQPLKFPDFPGVSFAAKDLIRCLLEKDPQQRLGFKRGASEIKQHYFFENVNWALVRSSLPPEVAKPLSLDIRTVGLYTPPPTDLEACDSDNSSGSYLDFEFF